MAGPLDFVMRNVEIVMVGGNPVMSFMRLTGDVDVTVENINFTTSIPGIFWQVFFIHITAGSGHVIEFNRVRVEVDSTGYVYSAIQVVVNADAERFRAAEIYTYRVNTAIYYFIQGYPSDVYIQDVESDGQISIYLQGGLQPLDVVIRGVKAYYTRFILPAIYLATTRNLPNIVISDVTVMDGRTGGIFYFCFECNATVDIDNIVVATTIGNAYGVYIVSNTPRSSSSLLSMEANIRNVDVDMSGGIFGRCVSIATFNTVNRFNIGNIRCRGVWWGVNLYAWFTGYNELYIRNAEISASYRGIEVLLNHHYVARVFMRDVSTTVAGGGLDGYFRVNRFLISYQSRMWIDIERWMVSDDPGLDIAFFVNTPFTFISPALQGEVRFSKVDRVSLAGVVYVNFTETVMEEHLSIFDPEATSYSRWTLAEAGEDIYLPLRPSAIHILLQAWRRPYD